MKWHRWIPGLSRAACYLGLASIPIFISFRFHFLPFDDCLRHAAKAISGKDWSQVLVLRDGVTLDQHPGWHALLAAVHRATDCDQAFLVIFEWTTLFILFSLAALPLLRRPEAWAGAMLLAAVALPRNFVFRLTRGRPYILAMTAEVLILFLWRPGALRPWPRRVLAVALVALTTWVHGSWYLWALLVPAFFLAGHRRLAAEFIACWIAGAGLGAALTGQPLAYLAQQVAHARLAFGQGSMHRMLVGEFQSDDGSFALLAAAALVVLFRRAAGASWREIDWRAPAFCAAILAWIAGLQVFRVWHDWGIPALLVWLSLEIQALMEQAVANNSPRRLLLAGGVAGAMFLAGVGDQDGRWSTLEVDPPAAAAAAPGAAGRGWMPEPGGIVYSADMGVFNQWFYDNPQADWRYVCGFEAGLMPADDLRILREIQRHYKHPASYRPWIAKMQPADRLVLTRQRTPPDLPHLEWLETEPGTWVGRLPAAAADGAR